MRRAWAVAAVVTLLPGAATALSCAEYSVSDSYWYYKERPETFVLASGTFFDLELVSSSATEFAGEELKQGRKVYSARFEGFRASSWAFDQPFSAPVTLIFPDFSVYGGYDSAVQAKSLPGEAGLVWLMQTDDGYQATVELCEVFIDKDPASTKPALACLAGRRCPKP